MMQIRIGKMSGWWYVQYRDGGRWGRHHYGSLSRCVRCWVRVKRGKEPFADMKPYGEHL